MSVAKKEAIKQYYLILKAHMQLQPRDLRTLGDSMVKQEFRQHFTGDGKYMIPFCEGWQNYYEQLVQSDSYKELAQNMTEDDKSFQTSEMKDNLKQLRQFTEDEFTKK